jgi:hypothetical protein
MPKHDALAGNYELECTFCGAKAKVQMNLGAGWRIGQVLEPDPTEPARGRCHQCKRHAMKVISVPPPPPLPRPKGFRIVPEK